MFKKNIVDSNKEAMLKNKLISCQVHYYFISICFFFSLIRLMNLIFPFVYLGG